MHNEITICFMQLFIHNILQKTCVVKKKLKYTKEDKN